MINEQLVINRFKEVSLLLNSMPTKQTWKRRMLVKEYNVLHAILFEYGVTYQ